MYWQLLNFLTDMKNEVCPMVQKVGAYCLSHVLVNCRWGLDS
jgi:hypothetical protein